ncbi:nucleoside-diphosphate-sugar epimerase [Candidatus Magnetobacterium bavaricum]|uniref:Nucleoside-diphosphate-sugar epimerase n=1 Tax=Candidatus Magnetobacterium bavaricum TaxID=29290 RepID=A0A0F3GJH8_9BACT|nr:nucleoside-diphosphate-sugar epimerase [Candidatus Magnetobacterium bavaricum]
MRNPIYNVIVFGGAGFLGSHVADALSESGHKVKIFDLKASPYLKPSQEMIEGDILDEEGVRAAIKDTEIVYNFAGIADIEEATSKPIETIKYNILGNTILLEASREERIKRFLYASTIYVYSDSGSFYRCSKAACENYIETYHKQYGIDYTILRYGTLYGTRADEKNIIFRFITQAMMKNKMQYIGNGEEIREYINVLDAAKASVEILSEEFRNEHIIFTGHYPLKVKDMMGMIKEMLKRDITIELIPPGSDDPMTHYNITPYTFIPKVGKKYIKHYYTDMGQGLLLCMQEVYDKLQNGELK